MIEIVNREYLREKVSELRKYCRMCSNRGTNTCRYCTLGTNREVYWEEEDEGKNLGADDKAGDSKA